MFIPDQYSDNGSESNSQEMQNNYKSPEVVVEKSVVIEKAQEVIDEVEANLEFTPISGKERHTPDERLSTIDNQLIQRIHTE